jgi:hypothetical protein
MVLAINVGYQIEEDDWIAAAASALTFIALAFPGVIEAANKTEIASSINA